MEVDILVVVEGIIVNDCTSKKPNKTNNKAQIMLDMIMVTTITIEAIKMMPMHVDCRLLDLDIVRRSINQMGRRAYVREAAGVTSHESRVTND